MEPFGTDLSSKQPKQAAAEALPMSDEYQRAIAYLYERINYEKTADTAPYPFRLRRMTELLDRFDLHGIAGQTVPIVHIAGTKGKGSTSAMVASMLTAGGFRTGLYTSPHLTRLEERFTVDGESPTEREVVSMIEAIAVEADRMAQGSLGAPTFFEVTTAIALMYFRDSGCTAVVLEVGLGGKLDSTNVCYPAVTAITTIGFDHQHILGNTLGEIASQKAGIIKTGIPVVSGVVQKEACSVIDAIAKNKNAPRFSLGQQFDAQVIKSPSASDWSTHFNLISHDKAIRGREAWKVPLDGIHQAANASLACVIMDLLESRGTVVPQEDQKSGLSQTKIAGRVERFQLRPGVDAILDTSHNVDSVAALCQCIEQRREDRPVTIVFGTSRDKEHRPMLQKLCDHCDAIILTRYHGNPRYRETQELFRDLPANPLAAAPAARIEEDPVSAVHSAIDSVVGPHLIVICGSFFLAAEVRPLLLSLAPPI
jgi:dihydrofolate synthase / folylpolyglutamate synthase